MIQTFSLSPGVTLRCFEDTRLKQNHLSARFVRVMDRQEAAMNALLPAVLLRGCRSCPDLRAITQRLDDLYGASVWACVNRVGDYHAIGLACGCIEDRYAMTGDRVFGPMTDFLRELLLEPALEKGCFREDFVQSEKKNLISTIESQRNDKRYYASSRLGRLLCQNDSFGIPRLGEPEQVAAITCQDLYRHYQKVLTESPVELFYVGSAAPEAVAGALRPMFDRIPRKLRPLPPQSDFHPAPYREETQVKDVTQARLCMGFVSPITLRHRDFAPMQVFNTLFGAGMTSKLFMNLREKTSLCYDIGSSYQGSKGLLTVTAGIDESQYENARKQILAQWELCCQGAITAEELSAAKQAIVSQLRTVHDSHDAIAGYYATAALSGLTMTPAQYMAAVEAVTADDAARAARSLELRGVYFLKGDTP